MGERSDGRECADYAGAMVALAALQDEVVERMARCWRELRRGPATMIVRDRIFGTDDGDFEPAQVDVLELLVQRDGWRMNELASALGVDPSTVTRTLQRMEHAGLAVRTPHDHDGRVVMVHITTAGQRGHDIVLGRRRDILEQLLARFDDDDRLQLVELVERFIVDTYEYVGLGAPRGPAHGSPAAAAG